MATIEYITISAIISLVILCILFYVFKKIILRKGTIGLNKLKKSSMVPKNIKNI